jgi:hypothetical protein
MAVAFAMSSTATGCGSDGTDSRSGMTETLAVTTQLQSPRKCLVSIGASMARSSADINFFLRDLVLGDTSKPGGAGYAGVEVGQYEPVKDLTSESSIPHPAYQLWVGRAASESEPDVAALADDERSDTFVAFIRGPSKDQQRRAWRCLERFGAPPRPHSGAS